MKRGRISKDDKEFIIRYIDKGVKFIANKIERSVEFVNKIIAEHEECTQIESKTETDIPEPIKANHRDLVLHPVDKNDPKRGNVSMMTEAMSARTDDGYVDKDGKLVKKSTYKRYTADPSCVHKPLG